MIHYIEMNQLTNEVLNSNKFTIAEFCMPNSEPSEKQTMLLRDIEKEYRDFVEVYKIEILNLQEATINYQIVALPTLIFYHKSSEIERKIGYTDENTIVQLIKEFIQKD